MRQVGRYEIVSEIASGGMATVYLARSRGSDGFSRTCAVKLLHPHLAKERGFAELFLDEARIAARVGHPNVCQIHDFGRADDGTAYIAMEYLDGRTLSQVLAATFEREPETFSPETIAMLASVLAEAADGLAAAHEQLDSDGAPLDIVHRDVSPQNVFVSFDGAVKVLDFGIARARDQIHETAPGEVKGKFGYMAPEQMRGEPLDARADVWALGVMLWEVLARARLFRRDTQAATVDAVQRDPIKRPSELTRGVPPGLEELAMRSLERDRDRRTARAREFARSARAAARSLSEHTARSDLADWMQTLFPRDAAAREGRRDSDAPTAPAPAAAVPAAVVGPATKPATSLPRSALDEATQPSRFPRWRAAAVTLGVVGVAVVMGGLAAFGGWPAPAPEAAVATAAPPEPIRSPPPPEPAPTSAVVVPHSPATGPPVQDVEEAPALPARPLARTSPRARAQDPTGERPTRDPPPAVAENPAPDPNPATVASPPVTTGHGCLVVELGSAIRVDGGRPLYGPLQCVRLAAGAHRLERVDDSGAPIGPAAEIIAEPGVSYRAASVLPR